MHMASNLLDEAISYIRGHNITLNSLCRDCLLLICVSRLFVLAFKKITSLLSIPTHMKTLTNWKLSLLITVAMLDVTRLQQL